MSLTSIPHVLQHFLGGPLAIDRRTVDAFLAILRRRDAGISFGGAELHADLGIAAPRPPRQVGKDHQIAIIPIVGMIANRAFSMGAGALDIQSAVDNAAADSRVAGIVLDIDSPGGTITGVPELARAVFQARKTKPVIAQANGLMASAAYWVGSAADRVFASPSSRVGSIGIMSIHEDWSQWLEGEGIKITEITAGRYKTEGAPWKPLDEEAQSFLQSEVRDAYNWFVRDVARFRGVSVDVVRSGYGEGRVLMAADAKEAGLIDDIRTMDQTIEDLGRQLADRRTTRNRTVAMVEARRRARERSY